MTSTLELLPGLSAVAPRYDAVICDVWGVIHNGVAAYRTACDALENFRKARGPVLLLSNAPRPHSSIQPQLDRFGVARAAYDAILTSGDATRAELMRRTAARPGLPVLHIGPERDAALFDGIAFARADIADAELVLCSGLYDDDTETPDDYTDLLKAMRARDLTMICANPDLQVERGSQILYCAGALAAAYEKLGGKVIYYGKPHRPVYDQALERLDAIAGRALERARVLAIGDGLKTDIRGANDFAIPALLVTGGLHAADFGPHPENPDIARVRAALDKAKLSAIGAQGRLKW